jgi:hypothetical protein
VRSGREPGIGERSAHRGRGGMYGLAIAVDFQVNCLIDMGPGDGSAHDSRQYDRIQAVLHGPMHPRSSRLAFAAKSPIAPDRSRHHNVPVTKGPSPK